MIAIRDRHLTTSISRHGNCHDNAVTESFFQLLKRERIKRMIYQTRVGARQDIFDYVEFLCNPVRKHSCNGNRSPIEIWEAVPCEGGDCLGNQGQFIQ